MTMPKPADMRDHRVRAVAMDVDKTLQWHAYCPDTPAAHFSENVSGFVAVFAFCNQDLWSWIVAILLDSMPSVIAQLLLTHTISFLYGSCCRTPDHMLAGVHGLTAAWLL